MSDSVPASTQAIAAYYDAACERCVRDYVHGNARIQHATEFALAELKPHRANRVLEIGCGIGSSSYAMYQSCAGLEVVGVDISESCIELARRLFPHPRLEFRVSAMQTAPVDGEFDAIVMLDVYEHIPRLQVPVFHDVLGKMLSRDGIILLTTPSPLHQARLAETNPAALQIVDETIGVEELARLAHDVDGTLTSFSYKRIWHTNDYVHSVIERAPRYERPQGRHSLGQKLLRKLPALWGAFMANRGRQARSKLVYRQLGVRIP